MLRRIGRNKPLAVAVLVLVSLPLIFHDYLIPPLKRIVRHIPPWAIEYEKVDFARDDFGLLLGQVAWLVRALQRKAVMEDSIAQELKWLGEARRAVDNGRSLLADRLAKHDEILKGRLDQGLKERHRETIASIWSDLEETEEYLARLESQAKAYDALRGDAFWINKLRRNRYRNRIFKQGERLLAVITKEDEVLAKRPLSPERLPTQIPEITPSGPIKLSANVTEDSKLASVLADMVFGREAFAAEPPGADDLGETPETRRSAAITGLAEQLRKDPVRIYEYVRNHIDYVPTVGSVQGAEGTLRSGYGNATDQASLLIALLRASGIPGRYVQGKVEVPVDKVKQWIGTEDANTAASIFNRNGVLANVSISSGGYAAIQIEHTWVRAYVPYEPYRGAGRSKGGYWIDLDPSFKLYETGPYLDVAAEIGVDPWSFLVSIKAESTVNEAESWASGVPETLIIDRLDGWADRVERYARANNRIPENLYQVQRIVPEDLQALPSTLPNKIIAESSESAALGPDQGYAVSIKLLNPDNSEALSYNTDILTLDHKRVTLSYIPATDQAEEIIAQYADETEIPAYLVDLHPQLMIDGEEVATGSGAVQMAADQYLSVTISGPGFVPREGIRPVPAGSYLALVFDPQGISTGNLYDELAGLRRVKEELESGSTTVPLNEVLDRTLKVMGMAYFQELDRMTRIAASSLRVHATRQPSFLTIGYEVVGDETYGVPLTAEAERLTISIDRNSLVPVSLTGNKVDEKQFMVTAGITAAALEHNVLVQTTGGEAASALRLVQAASTAGIPVYTITPENYNDLLTKPPLNGLPPGVLSRVGDAAHAQMIVTVPGEEIDYAGYSGIGYIVYDPATGSSGYFIEGGLAGGVRPAPWLTASDLISLTDPGAYLSMINPTLGWVGLAEDVTTSVAWRYSPAISAINNWFRNDDRLDKVAFIAAGIAISGPIGILTDRPEIARFVVTPTLFSPKGDGYLDEVVIRAGISRESKWDITVLDGTGTQVKVFTGTGQQIDLTWDGTDNEGSPLPDGLYTINADAIVADKDVPARTQSAQVELDITPPTAEITSITGGETVSGIVSVAGNADDLHFTDFSLDLSCDGGTSWENLNAETSPCLQGTLGIFDSVLYPAGQCIIRLTVRDSVGLVGTYDVTVYNQAQGQSPPEVSILEPADGTSVSGVIPVNISATDDLAVERVEIHVEGSLVATLTEGVDGVYTHELNTSSYANGPLTITARAYDEREVYAEDSVTVTLDNEIQNLAANPELFTPDGDGVDETVTISTDFTAPSNWTLEIKRIDGTSLKSFTGTGDTLSQVWDGADESGQIPQKAAFDCTALVTLTQSGTTAQVGFRLETINRPPELAIHSPKEEESITAPTGIVATVKDTDLDYWKLEFTEVKDGLNPEYSPDDWIVLAEGTEPVINKKIYDFDPTQMKNNPYLLRLRAQDKDIENPEKELIRGIFVSGELKVGLFTLSFEDLTVPLAGMSITVGRTYSSIERHTRGEFSYGWKMFIHDVDIKEDSGRNVTINLPDGRRVNFYYDLSCYNPLTCGAVWKAEDGVFDKLKMEGDNRLLVDALHRKILGFFHDYLAYVFPTPYEESVIPGYVLTTEDGTEYKIKKEILEQDDLTGKPTKWGPAELVSVTDLNNNRIIYDRDGIHYGCDASGANCVEEVIFTRDPDNGDRITAITDPAEKVINYKYDDVTGDLIEVIYQDGNSTKYNYAADHYLQDIIAPTGVTATRSEYDDEGRLIAVVDPSENRVEFTHKPDARQEVVRDRLGNITVYEYDDQGRVVSESNALGYRTEYAYDKDGNKIKEIDALGNVTTWTYDSRGNMLSETDPLGNTARYTYDSRGNLLTTSGSLGHVTSNQYDTAGNLISSTDALGNVTTYAYDSSGNMTSMTDALGHTTEYTYDVRGRLLTTTDAKGETSSNSNFDAFGNARSQTDRRDNTTVNTYDKRGRLLTTTDPLDNITTYEYNEAGLQITVKDPTGAVTVTVYDSQGRATNQIYPDDTSTSSVYDAEGRVVRSVDQAGAATETVYDALGRAVKTILPNGAETAVTYDALGRALRTKDARGGITSRDYDALGRTKSVTDALGNTTQYEYNALGRQVAMIDANGHRWGSEYDAMGRKTATVYPGGTRSSVEYDASGRKVAEIDQAGIRTEFIYDANGNLTGVNDAEGGHTGYEYDPEGNLLTITDPNEHTTSFTYDELGRKTSRKLPEEGLTEESWEYGCCQVSSHTDFNGDTITYQYDSMKLETLRTYPDGKTVTTTYNARGQRETVAAYDLGTRRFDYDIMGRLTKDIKEDGQFIDYKYDEAGNLIETRYSGDHAVHYTHDALNRLETVTGLSAEASAKAETTKYTYDKVGNRKSMTYPNETIATYEYDSLNRLIYLENKGPEDVISSYRYTLGPAGNRLKIEEHNGDICDYSYDKLYRLTRESRTGEHAYVIGYTYDPFGNRLEMNAGEAVTAYDYDDNDRLLTVTSSQGTTTYNYDNNGNTTGKSGPDGDWIYEWNLDNKLISAKLNDNDQPSASYQYDLDGERVKKTTPEGTTRFLIDTNNKTGYSQALRETDQSNTELVAYTFGDDLISQRRTETSYYHYDGLGSTRVISSAQTEITDTFIYQAFGSILSKTGSTDVGYLFTGESYDFNLGYYYLRARYMDPALGRFNTSDPYLGDIVIPYSLHRYLYAYANPIGNFDPSGQFTILNITINLNIRSILSSISTTSHLFYLQAAKLLNVTIGSLMFLTTQGRAALNVLANTGMRGVQALQTAFLRAPGAISRAQSSAAASWGSHSGMTRAMNKLLTGSKLNPPNIQWHDLVSQCAENISRFGPRAIHSVANKVPIPTHIHTAISNFYFKTRPRWLAPKYRRVHDWVITHSWEEQYEIALQILKQALLRDGRITWIPPG